MSAEGIKVELNPVQQLTAAANAEYDIIDPKGHVIKVRKPGVLAQYRLVEALGGKVAENQVYMGMILPFIYIVSIDGVPVHATNKLQIEGLITRLGDEGVQAVMEGVNKHFGPPPDAEGDRVALKNS